MARANRNPKREPEIAQSREQHAFFSDRELEPLHQPTLYISWIFMGSLHRFVAPVVPGATCQRSTGIFLVTRGSRNRGGGWVQQFAFLLQ